MSKPSQGVKFLGLPAAGNTSTADLSTAGSRQAHPVVCEVRGLAAGKHAVGIVNRGPGPVSIDAIVVRYDCQ